MRISKVSSFSKNENLLQKCYLMNSFYNIFSQRLLISLTTKYLISGRLKKCVALNSKGYFSVVELDHFFPFKNTCYKHDTYISVLNKEIFSLSYLQNYNSPRKGTFRFKKARNK